MNWNVAIISKMEKSVRWVQLAVFYAILMVLFGSTSIAILAQDIPYSAMRIIGDDNDLSTIWSIQAVDLDGDGAKDILTATTNEIAWYENLKPENPVSSNNFGPHQPITESATGLRFVYAVDVDQDGDVDLVANRSTQNIDLVIWYENVSGVFDTSYQIIATMSDMVNDAVFADVDRNGRIDIITHTNSTVYWHQNDGNYTSEWNTVSIKQTGASIQALDAADLNGDGLTDVIIAHKSNIIWYKNPGTTDANWDAFNNVPVGGSDVRDIFTADVDGNGRIDILAVEAEDNKVAWYKNIPDPDDVTDADFDDEENIIDGRASVNNPYSLTADDFDFDGDIDVAVVSQSGIAVNWYEQSQNASSGAIEWIPNEHSIDPSIQGAQYIESVDLDNDGDLDFLVGAFKFQTDEFSKIGWYTNNTIHRNISFAEQAQIIVDGGGAKTAVSSADLDRNGIQDIIYAQGNSVRAAFHQHPTDSDSGNWTIDTNSPLLSNFGQTPQFIIPTDFDLDGWTDLVIAGTNSIKWLENTGNNSNWTSHIIASAQSGAITSLQVADLDQNGSPDVIVGWESGVAPLTWYANQEGLTDPRQDLLEGEGYDDVQAFAVADYDRDGDIDIVASTFSAGERIVLIENDGNSSDWLTGETLTDGDGVVAIALADLNNDAHLDILVAQQSGSGGEIGWYENDKSGNSPPFFSLVNISAGLSAPPSSLVTQDLDADADIDMIVSLKSGTTAYTITNLGNELFSSAKAISGVRSIFASTKVNQDAQADLFTISGNQIVWFENNGGQFGFTTTSLDTFDPTAIDGDAILNIDVHHFGRANDNDLSLKTIELLFTDDGSPLGRNPLNNRIETITVYKGSSAGTQVGQATVNDNYTGNGRIQIDIEIEQLVAPQTSQLYVVQLKLSVEAAHAPTDYPFEITHVVENDDAPTSTAVDTSPQQIELKIGSSLNETAVVFDRFQVQYLPFLGVEEQWVEIGTMPSGITQFNDVAVCGDTILAGTDKGVYRLNSSNIWMRETAVPQKEVFHITFGGNGCSQAYASVWASGNNGEGIWCGSASGNNWNWNRFDTNPARKNADTVMVNNGRVFVGVDGNGLAWTPEPNNCSVANNWTSALPGTNVFGLNEYNGNIWASTWGAGIYRSSNNGDSWVNIGPNSGRYFEAIGDGNGQRIAGEADALLNWSVANWQPIPASSTTYAVEIINDCFYTGQKSYGVRRSCNGTNNWQALNNGFPSDLFNIDGRIYGLFYNRDNNTLYSATTEGVFSRKFQYNN